MGWDGSISGAWESASEAGRWATGGVVSAASAVGRGISSTVSSAYGAVQDFFSPHLVGQPIQPCPSDLDAKRSRLRKRALLIQKARAVAPSLPEGEQVHVLEKANRFERDITAVERARLAQDVYPGDGGRRGDSPLGWSRLSDSEAELKKLGLVPNDLAPKGSGFRAALYRSEIDGSVVVAYKGTTFSNLEDWKNNVVQGAGFKSDYYERAIRLAGKIDAGGVPFEVTGHSLGGGLASAAAVVAHARATTFNAAGINATTVEKYGVSTNGHDDLVQAYHVDGEVLTGVQHMPLVPNAIGKAYVLPAVDDTGRSSVWDNFKPVDKHGMDRVINGLEKEKADDQHALETCISAI